jgi:acetolactate synthase-1/2/3 large subunit
MRVADYVFDFVANKGIRHVFFVSGGGAMHLNDALGKNKNIQYVCNLHEQACAMAAEGYARISNAPGVINVTTGPGGTNAVTGVLGAWIDSVPMLIISGQVKRATLISRNPELHLRQLGDQEADIISIVKPITKYAALVMDEKEIRWQLEKAWHLATTGRPGPVWLDIPLDVQAAEVANPDELQAYPLEQRAAPDKHAIQTVFEKIRQAKRPVIIAGYGIRLAHALPTFQHVVDQLKIPVLTTISGIDLLPTDHPYFYGRPGLLGERSANFIMQNADLVLILGTRMSLRILSYAYETFAREAHKIMVDIDAGELQKPTLQIDTPLCMDVGDFLDELNHQGALVEKKEWLDYCSDKKRRYPIITDEHRAIRDVVSSYILADVVSDCLKGDEIIVTGNGIAYTSTFQAIRLKKGNRMFANMGCAAMGYDIPAAIGASFAAEGHDIICFCGDGSIQMNIQEFQTIVHYNLPIKMLMLNNDGYLSIKHTQRAFFNDHFVGSHPASGVVLPDMQKIASAYGLPTFLITNPDELKSQLPKILALPGPVFCELICAPFEAVGPKSASRKLPDGRMVSSPLEDLYPFLNRKEFLDNMLVKPLDEGNP